MGTNRCPASRLPCFERRVVLKKQANSAALYCRLSRDDGGDAESNSIQTQRMMLQRFANEHGLTAFDEYIERWHPQWNEAL